MVTTRIPCLNYSIVVGTGALDALARDIAPGGGLGFTRGTSRVVITDTNVWRLHGSALLAALAAAAPAGTPAPLVRQLPPGEGAKTRGVKEGIEDWMLRAGCLRDTLVIAFGGGVVGDLAGFVAATYMRGVAVVQVPTTLLAAVDSSIGGKTGLDVPAGKNLVGAFHQPRGVYADPTLLSTLPLRELSNGMAEVIKCGAIAHEELFALCEARADDILGVGAAAAAAAAAATATAPAGSSPSRHLDLSLLTYIIAEAAAVKARVVTEDEKEGGLRATLNAGHTVGHGIEAVMQPTLLHGECVAIGLVKEAEASRALGHADSALVNRVKRVCASFRLPTAVPHVCSGGRGLADVMAHMSVDKKNVKGEEGVSSSAVTIKCVLLTTIGGVLTTPAAPGGPPRFAHAVPAPLLHRLLSRAVALTPPAAVAAAPSATSVRVPGSKSISNRALLLAGLSRGTTLISGLLASDDTQVMLKCLSDLGATVTHGRDAHSGAPILEVTGTGGVLQLPPVDASVRGGFKLLYVQNAGTASRFLASLLPLLPLEGLAAAGQSVMLAGNERMAVRPIGPLVSALRAQGAVIECTGKHDGCPPLAVSAGISPFQDSLGCSAGAAGGAPLSPRRRVVCLAAKLSSQYVSSILMSAPYFPAVLATSEEAAAASATAAATLGGCISDDPTQGDPAYVELRLAEEHPTSLPYITMTLAAMSHFGVNVLRLADNRYLVPRTVYSSPGRYDIEADASSASYPAAIGAVRGTGFSVVLEGVGSSSVQGDAGFPALLGRMGAVVSQDAHRTLVGPPDFASGRGFVGIDVNMEDQTDCFMTLAAVAALAQGVTRITGVANQRVKECNRIAAMVTEFAKLGVVSRELPDGLEITGSGLLGPRPPGTAPPPTTLRGAPVHCYDDHRIAMSFAVMGSVVPGIIIDDAACVEKTYPEFWDHAASLFGLRVVGGDVSAPALVTEADGMSASIVLIGMRGAGKSTLAAQGAAALGGTWQFVDLDRRLEAEAGIERAGAGAPTLPIAALIAQDGWAAFRARELAVLRTALSGPDARGCVIACGGGIVETEEARSLLSSWGEGGGHVIEIVRDIDDIAVDLGLVSPSPDVGAAPDAGTVAPDEGRPAYAGGASLHETYERRVAWYRSCSSSSLCVPKGHRDYAATSARFSALLQQLVGGTDAASSPVLTAAAITTAARVVSWGTIAREWHAYSAWPLALPLRAASSEKQSSHQQQEQRTPPVWLTPGVSDGTSFVCLAVPDLRALLPPPMVGARVSVFDALSKVLHAVACGVSAVELRVDALVPPSPAHALDALSLLRAALQRGASLALESDAPPGARRIMPATAHAAPPIIFTVRSAAEGGFFTGDETSYANLVRAGIRGGAEWLDIEAGRASAGSALRQSLAAEARRSGARVIASAHWPAPAAPPTGAAFIAAALACYGTGGTMGDVVKLVVAARNPGDAAQLQVDTAAAQAALADAAASAGAVAAPPLVSLAMGEAGRLSRVSNSWLTPVTHPLLPNAAAPGQLSAHAIMALRSSLGLIRPRSYFLFGSPISHSISPALHNAGFATLGLPHKYGLVETADPRVLSRVLLHQDRPAATLVPIEILRGEGGGDAAAFAPAAFPSYMGGGNVTIPLKQEAMSLCHAISPEAAAIGAVNVLVAIPRGKGADEEEVGDGAPPIRLFGDNTDWLAIYWSVRAALAARAAAASTVPVVSAAAAAAPTVPCGLIVGAGGTALAVAYAFARLGLPFVVHNPRTPAHAHAIASRFSGGVASGGDLSTAETGAVPPRYRIDVLVCTLPPSVAWTAPAWLLDGSRPVVMDVAYSPRNTPLLAQATAAGCATIEGVEMLVGQGLAAFALWTGRASHSGALAARDAPRTLGGVGVPVVEMTRAAYQCLERTK